MRALFLVVIVASAFGLFFHLGSADIRGGDEGAHAVMARGLALGITNFINPSPHPAGPPGATPDPYPLLLSLLVPLAGCEFWMIAALEHVAHGRALRLRTKS